MSTYLDSRGQQVPLGQQLGVGGQGAVYAVAGRRDAVAKIYLQQPGTQAIRKLEALTLASDAQLQSVSAWPQTVLRDSAGTIRGFLMPMVSDKEYQEIHMLYRMASRRQHFPKADWSFLVHVARNVARAFAALHARGFLMGDVSSRNVMVSQNGTVRFIDTDSFQIKVGTEIFPCPVGTAEFTPPELQGKGFGTLIRHLDHDLFGLALLIFHLLFEGRHPYAGIHDNGLTPSPGEAIAADKFAYSLQYRHGVKPPPFVLPLQALHGSLVDLFERAFSPRHSNRPTATQWDQVLAEVFNHLTTCSNNPDHKHDRRLPCPWCALLPANAQAATTKTGIPGFAKTIDVEAELNRIWLGVRAVPAPPPPSQVTLRVVPTPLALPTPPAPPQAPTGVSTAAAVWGGVFILVGFYVLIQGGGWMALLIFGGLSWYNFNKNSASNVRTRQVIQAQQQQVQYKQQYQTAFGKHLQQYNREADDLRRQLSQAYALQQGNSAQRQHQMAIRKLEDLRAEVRALEAEEQEAIKSVVQRHRAPLLERHLAQYPIRPGQIPGVGPALVATLNQHGIRTARDVTVNVRWIKGVGPKRQQDLVEWRETLEQFFQFNPAHVPPKEFEAVRDQFDQKRRTKLRLLETAAQELSQDIPKWLAAEKKISQDIHELKLELARREKTVELIERGEPTSNSWSQN